MSSLEYTLSCTKASLLYLVSGQHMRLIPRMMLFLNQLKVSFRHRDTRQKYLASNPHERTSSDPTTTPLSHRSKLTLIVSDVQFMFNFHKSLQNITYSFKIVSSDIVFGCHVSCSLKRVST